MTTNSKIVILGSDSFVFTILPLSFVIFIFGFLSKRKNRNKDISKKEKDDLGHIIKKYVKMTGRIGYEISDLTLYARPSLKDLNGFIYKSEVSKAKQKSKLTEEKYKKPKKEKKYSIEDYFQEKEQQLMSQSLTSSKKQIYVVCFRLKERDDEESNDGECIEIELYKENNNDTNYSVKFNQELNYQTESMGIYTMQMEYLNDKYEESKRKLERTQQKEKGKNIKGKFFKILNKAKYKKTFKN